MEGTRKYNALRNVPWQVMADIKKKIQEMPSSNEKEILSLYFIEGKRPQDIIGYCEEHNIKSRNGTFYTTRSIQNIVSKYFPEVKQYRKHNPDNEKRREHFKFIREHERVPCGRCGNPNGVHWHHMMPQKIGGEAVTANLVCLCHRCHVETTNYNDRFIKRKGWNAS